MKVSCVKPERVVVTLETPEEIAWVRAAVVPAHPTGGSSRVVAELVEAVARAGRAPRVRAMTITLETPDEIQQLKTALAGAHEPLADALRATVATVAAWGPVTYRWVTPPPLEPVTVTPAWRTALGWRLGWLPAWAMRRGRYNGSAGVEGSHHAARRLA